MRTRIVLLCLVAGFVAVGFTTGLFDLLTPERLRGAMEEAGPWGPALMVLLFAFLEPFGVPSLVFLFAAAAIWPFWLALAVNWIGAIGAGMVGFGFARIMGRGLVSDRLPERVRRWDERLSNDGLWVVVAFRFVFFVNPPSHWALGLSRVPLHTAALATVIGFLPWAFVFTYFGAAFVEVASEYPGRVALAVAAIVLTVVAIRRTRGRRRGATAQDPAPAYTNES